MMFHLSLRVALAGCCFAISSTASAEQGVQPFTVRFASVGSANDDAAPQLVDPADPAPAPTIVIEPKSTPTPEAAAPRRFESNQAVPREAAAPVAPARRRTGSPAPQYAPPVDNVEIPNQTRRALGFYGGHAARATLSQMPNRTPVMSMPQQQPMKRVGKPFETVQSEPTISPYLNLYRDSERGASVPSYFTMFKPQMDQLEQNRMQQRDMQKLRGQLQNISSGGQSGVSRSSAHYMDTAQFYRGMQR